MAYSKANQFSKDEVLLSNLAKALAHPARIAILKFLASNKTCICGDIVEALPLSQSTVSQHLKELKKAGLIKGDIDGPRVCYCLDIDVCSIAIQALNKLFTGIKCC
jgi:DNA-binding transcriptional ArsR family regulator